ncbi:MAG: xanthan lyase, partial [Bacteroidales bacterium]|nr:xanthan lyase [Bacteroidales bacterium]
MKKLSLLILISLSTILFASAQGRVDNVARERFKNVSVEIDNYMYDKADLAGKIFVRRADVKNDTLNIAFCSTLAEYPVRDIDIERIYKVVKKSMPAKYSDYSNKFIITVNNVPLEKLSSGYYSKKERSDGVKSNAFKAEKYPLVRRVSNPSNPSNGLSGRHIAVWQSHGYYYEQSLKRWEWQRARIFETVEDLYTQSYVLPFLVPMLENAGANVILPRERDVQSIEIIVDNDESQFNGGNYYETNGLLSWGPTHWTGFANKKATYLYKENPFSMGTARVAKCVTEESGDSLSIAHWIAKVPESGEYAVYVSYGTLKGSTKSAHYTVHHNGGSTEFLVNQQMGGGTWIYLGTFGFMKESETQGVYLDNRGDTKYEYVTADGVKFGGGMGNIARNPSEVDEKGNKVEMD